MPFHWVKSTSDPDAVNMACSMKELQKGLKIMCLTNTKNLQPRVQLLQASKELLKQQAAQAAAQGAAQASKKRKAA